ncbi:hypothetical protein [uncultured Chryseobacterium sp.]|uniref:MBL fold metallo-hydrolase n=1 Tax=uncultured Chryseobacterium sp. TaxID=259322 RepID=UPI0025CC0440|nr:hypothetical protein [uncultured Chryseobacterium sp.]
MNILKLITKMDIMLESNFEFHPVGQGCFYSGYIKYEDFYFNMVYDCGTVSPRNFLTHEINKYKTNVQGDLDILIISHFDEDHINGVFELLQGTTCKNLIIPYYEPIERLILAISSAETDGGDYIEFLQNPITYFIERDFKIDRIIVIGRPNNDSDKVLNSDNISPDTVIDENKGFILQADFYDKADSIILQDIAEIDKNILIHSKIKFLKKPYRVQIQFWEFIFYLRNHSNQLLVQKVTKEINDLIISKGITILDLFDIEYLKDLKIIYEKNFNNDFNNTSLVTYHGPIKNDNLRTYFWCEPHCRLQEYNNKSGTLLTGDISLKTRDSIQKLINYYDHYMEKICFFQVPHHGAKANWNLTTSNELPAFCVYIINHGIGRKNHPGLEVIENIRTNYGTSHLKLCNEVEDFRYICFYT